MNETAVYWNFMMFPITFMFFIFIFIGINTILLKRKNDTEYCVIDSYLLKNGTPIYYKSFRHTKIYIGRISHHKSINLYLLPDGRLLETVSNSLIDKELTELDKDVLVLKIEDNNNNIKLLSYAIDNFSKDKQSYLLSLEIGDKIKLKEITNNITDSDTHYSSLLIKE